MKHFAENTSVSVEKTRAELETYLREAGADAFGYMTDARGAMIQFKAHGKFIRFVLPLPDPKDKRFTQYTLRGCPKWRTAEAATKEWEQGCRSAWRALFLAIKAKFVAVQTNISTFEHEFLAQIVLPDGSTAGDVMIPQIEETYKSGKMPVFQLQLPPPAA